MASATLLRKKGHLIDDESSYHRSSRSSTEADVSVLCMAVGDDGLDCDVRRLTNLDCDVVETLFTRDDATKAEGVGTESPRAGENAPAWSSGTDRVKAINAALLDRDDPPRLLLLCSSSIANLLSTRSTLPSISPPILDHPGCPMPSFGQRERA